MSPTGKGQNIFLHVMEGGGVSFVLELIGHITIKPLVQMACDYGFWRNSCQEIGDLLNSENLKVAIAQLCNEIQVCNFIMI